MVRRLSASRRPLVAGDAKGDAPKAKLQPSPGFIGSESLRRCSVYRRRDSNPSPENPEKTEDLAADSMGRNDPISEKHRNSEPSPVTSRPSATPQPEPTESELEAAIVRATLADRFELAKGGRLGPRKRRPKQPRRPPTSGPSSKLGPPLESVVTQTPPTRSSTRSATARSKPGWLTASTLTR
jgi:hypothetical protein